MSRVAAEFTGSSRFQVVRRLGAGGMGVVYEAWDRQHDTRVALKTLRTLTGDALLRFKNEFRALADIQHHNLVSLGELICEDDYWFFTMELVEGVPFLRWVRPGDDQPSPVERTDTRRQEEDATQDLAASPPPTPVAAENPMNEQRLRDSLGQLAQGLAALHAAGKVHRDVKPSNILCTPEGRVVLLDFGVIADVEDHDDKHIVGTALYMAPEQGEGTVGPAADWYSLGVVLYQALTGKLPFKGEPRDVLDLKQRVSPPAPRASIPSLPHDLDQLCSELLQRDPAKRPSGDEILRLLRVEGGRGPQAAPFVGRREELAQLEAALAEARAGKAIAVYVHGESGVGKSALVRQFSERARKQHHDLVVLHGRCYERESVPYRGVDGVVDALSRLMIALPEVETAALLPRHVAVLAQVFPVLRRVDAIARAKLPPIDQMEPREIRTRVFGAMRELLTRLADQRPVILSIDDFQWADADSLALMAEILRAPDSPALLLVATLREAPQRLLGEGRNLHLSGLPPPDARALARRLLGRAGPGELIASPSDIADEAEGHPLFIAELVRRKHVVGSGAERLRLDDALLSRIRALDPEARSLLELVAVAGTPLPQPVAAQAARLDFTELVRLVSSLRVANLVRVTAGMAGDAVEPYHDRVRAAVLRQLDPEAKRACHGRLARALEWAGGDAEALATHFAESGDRDSAARHAAEAAAQATAALAFDRAARLYRHALELGAPHAAQLKRTLAESLANAGRGAEAAQAYREAAEASPEDSLDLNRRAAEQLLISGHLDEGLAAIGGVLEQVGLSLPKTPNRALASLLYQRAKLRLRGLSFKQRSERDIPPKVLEKIDICWAVSAGLAIIDTIRGADFQTRSLLLSLDAGEPYRVARALAMEAGFNAADGIPGEKRAGKLLEEARVLAERLRLPHPVGLCRMIGGISSFCFGKWRDSLKLTDESIEILRNQCTGVSWEVASAHLAALWSLFYLGELNELARRVPLLLREAQEHGDLYAVTNLRGCLYPLVLLAADDPETARRELAEGMSAWSQSGFTFQHYNALVAGAQIELYAGDAAAGQRLIDQSWKPLEKSLLLMMQQSRLEAWHLRGRVALLAGGRDAEAVAHGKRVTKEAVAWATPLGRLLEAAVAYRKGDGPRALGLLERAAAELEATETRLYAQAARRRIGQLSNHKEVIFAADTWMSEHGVRDPRRMTAMLAPGFD
jgi:Cdc6-like AAA superfamily ATPase